MQPEAGTPLAALTSYSVHQATLPMNITVLVLDFANRTCVKPHVVATLNVTAGEMHQHLLYEAACKHWPQRCGSRDQAYRRAATLTHA